MASIHEQNLSSGVHTIEKPDRTLLVLSLDYPPNDGGISRLVSGLVSILVAKGVNIRVATFGAQGRMGLTRPDAPCISIDRRRGSRDWQLFRAVRRYVRAYGRDTPILTSVWNPEATLALIAGAKRLSILAHGNEVMTYGKNGLKSLVRRWVLAHARIVICNSRFTEKLVRQITPSARTAVLNPAVDADAFCPHIDREKARAALNIPAERRLVITVARLDPIKGHETVLRAMARTAPRIRENLHYAIIGKGEMLGALQALAKELRLSNQVSFVGFVADDELLKWYAAADLFVLTSIVDPKRRGMEGFGMAFSEAQAAGLPVIGTRSGGIPDAIVEGEGGWLIAEGDVNALARHFERLHDDPMHFVEQGALGAARVRRDMSWQQYADRILALI